ncbi:MAG: hypothetical protein HY040_24540 [Planctomycetes bacterium]|nr:hypothetical protein [Planctomycetota bacterium]
MSGSFLILGIFFVHPALSPGDGELVLTPDERQPTLELAEAAIKKAGLLKGKMVLTSSEVSYNRRRGKTERMALLTHYRYDGDVAIQTSIHLGKREVLKVEAVPHMPTSLALEELAVAEKLARAHPSVAKALAGEKDADKIEVDALMHYTTDEKSPSYQHRVVRLFFRQGRTYLLYGPVIEVDLTTETVRVEEQASKHP